MAVLAELRASFRPEFLNRVDDMILFSRLDRAQLRQIVTSSSRGVRDRLAARKLTLHVTDAAVDASPTRATTRRTAPVRSSA